jgi:tRNA (cytidine/uridine-2'-O-)-methyltransferase
VPIGEKLRAKPTTKPFHVVLVEPEIPPNTGAIARTCAATGARLHLVGTLGFKLDAQSVRRAGLDYWHLVDLRRHEDVAAFEASEPSARTWLFSASGRQSLFDADIQLGDTFVFGRESVGLPHAMLAANPDRVLGIPTLGGVRSLNLSNAVSIVLYEALRRCGALDEVFLEPLPDVAPEP